MSAKLAEPAPPFATSDKKSFAYISAKDRWPVIVVSPKPISRISNVLYLS